MRVQSFQIVNIWVCFSLLSSCLLANLFVNLLLLIYLQKDKQNRFGYCSIWLNFSNLTIQCPIDSNIYYYRKRWKKNTQRKNYTKKFFNFKFIAEILLSKLFINLLINWDSPMNIYWYWKYCAIVWSCVCVIAGMDLEWFGSIHKNCITLFVKLNAWIHFKIEYFMKRSHLIR